MNWQSYFLQREYDQNPTVAQKRALDCLIQLDVFEDLKEFKPIFVGTIPLAVDIAGSDIDLICEISDFSRFQNRLRECFADFKNFLITESYASERRHLVCRFEHDGFRIEVYGEKKEVLKQNGYLHMIAEAKLLEIGGENARNEIRSLKNKGIKTEPAFAQYFGISGDPYAELLNLAQFSIEELRNLIKIS